MHKWIMEQTGFEADQINSGLAVSPWNGHRQFAYDLVAFVQPARIVELGTHYGCSFFSFLQAAKDHQLNTEVVAIDCWMGDEQAGFYGDEVLNTVKTTLNDCFPQQNYRLIRKFFNEALNDIEDESVDILHIDGLHTYEAVSEDFHNWMPKLKKNGVMLFHDIASELGYGTNQFWMEICEKYEYHYTFEHSWGLGVLFPKGRDLYDQFEANNFRDKLMIYEYRAMYDLCHKQLEDHKKMIDARDGVIHKNEEMINARDGVIHKNEEMINARDEAIRKNEEMIDARDEVIRKNEEMINARDEAIHKNEEMIDARDKEIEALKNTLNQLEQRNLIQRIANKKE